MSRWQVVTAYMTYVTRVYLKYGLKTNNLISLREAYVRHNLRHYIHISFVQPNTDNVRCISLSRLVCVWRCCGTTR